MYFSVVDRDKTKEFAQLETFDVLIIGGGITGAGIALDAAARGLSVLLIEMQDFAAGTSSRSTKLVHGGLRYLKQMELKEVAELGRERAIVYENGPHVTTPISMLLPFYKGGTFGQISTSVALKIYDVLAGVKKEERRFMLSKEETLGREPLLQQRDLVGSGMYVEYRTDDARLTMEVMKAAFEKGALLFNYMKATAIRTNNLAFTEVVVEDQLTGSISYFKARKVINAAGPWVDEVRKLEEKKAEKQIMLSKGVHLVFDQRDFPLQQAIYFDTEEDGRMVFAIPRDGKTYVGTTDTFYRGDPAHMVVTEEDCEYLLAAIRYMFPQLNLTAQQVESSWAGVRPLIHQEGKAPSEISRKDEIWQSEKGLITIAGGKLTGYRKMAEKIVDLVVEQLKVEYNANYRPCSTKKLPLSGGDLSGSRYFEMFVEKKKPYAIQVGVPEEIAEKIIRLYGTNIDKVLTLMTTRTNLPAYLYGQLQYGILYESVAKPSDFFIRRTGYVFFDMPLVEQYKEDVIEEMAKVLNWSEEQKQTAKEELERDIAIAKMQRI